MVVLLMLLSSNDEDLSVMSLFPIDDHGSTMVDEIYWTDLFLRLFSGTPV